MTTITLITASTDGTVAGLLALADAIALNGYFWESSYLRGWICRRFKLEPAPPADAWLWGAYTQGRMDHSASAPRNINGWSMTTMLRFGY